MGGQFSCKNLPLGGSIELQNHTYLRFSMRSSVQLSLRWEKVSHVVLLISLTMFMITHRAI
ncbi:MAG: hypothetical protein C0602_08000 [Denitrovibrio sp.]|nr:MAG: hypothetical protein C0602_08000 [Denitrovibrio sp.]